MSEREDELIQRVARELRRPVHIDPALDARVMTEIAALARAEGVTAAAVRPAAGARPGADRRGGLGAAWDWLRRPRAVSISPLGVLAAAAVVGVLLFGTLRAPALGTRHSAVDSGSAQGDGPADSAESPVPSLQSPVQFVLVAPGASAVTVVGDFNDWDSTATRLRPAAAGGVWSVTVPLAPGRHRYAFIVDGQQWRPDPNAPRARDDDFGIPSSVVTVGERRT